MYLDCFMCISELISMSAHGTGGLFLKWGVGQLRVGTRLGSTTFSTLRASGSNAQQGTFASLVLPQIWSFAGLWIFSKSYSTGQ